MQATAARSVGDRRLRRPGSRASAAGGGGGGGGGARAPSSRPVHTTLMPLLSARRSPENSGQAGVRKLGRGHFALGFNLSARHQPQTQWRLPISTPQGQWAHLWPAPARQSPQQIGLAPRPITLCSHQPSCTNPPALCLLRTEILQSQRTGSKRTKSIGEGEGPARLNGRQRAQHGRATK